MAEEKKKFQVRCPVCGHIYEYEEKDLVFTEENRLGASICPVCGVEVSHTLSSPVKEE